ncbi:YALIA101S05e03290g1_1 [Yarrowia lipolytica]|nr:Hypothetical protein YALI2_E01705g [Yarrowia lipolytica]SEI34477.1 YALIA101S05e03290g1_1 [Yarrowia lipolytica]VBB79194.1 Hypothetical protein conserved in the Yarrowia clade [Yarrowia lipolytica]
MVKKNNKRPGTKGASVQNGGSSGDIASPADNTNTSLFSDSSLQFPTTLKEALIKPEQLYHRKEGLLLDYDAEFVSDAKAEGTFKPKADREHILSFPEIDDSDFPAEECPTLTFQEHAQIRDAIASPKTKELSPAVEKKLKDIYTRNKDLIVLSMSGGDPRGLSDLYLRVCMQTRCVRFMRSDQILLWVTSMELYRAEARDKEVEILKKAPQYKAKQAVFNFAPLRDKFLDIACYSVMQKFSYSSTRLGVPWVQNHEFYIMLEAIKHVVFSDGVSSPLNRLLDKYQQVIRIQDTLRLYNRPAVDKGAAERKSICGKLALSRHFKDPKEISDFIIQTFASWVPNCRGLSSQMRRKIDDAPKREVKACAKNYESRFFTRYRSYADDTMERMSQWEIAALGKNENNIVCSADMLTDVYVDPKNPELLRGKVCLAEGGYLEAVYDDRARRDRNVLSSTYEIISRPFDDPGTLFVKKGNFSRVVSVLKDCGQEDAIFVQMPLKEDTLSLTKNINNCDFLNGNGVRFSTMNRESRNIPKAHHKTPFTTPFSAFYTPTSFRSPMPLDTVLIDISGPYPMTLTGCQWLMVVFDYSSLAFFTVTAKSLASLNREMIKWLDETPRRLFPRHYKSEPLVGCIQYHGPDSSPAAPYHKNIPNSPRKALFEHCKEKRIFLQDYQGMRYSRYHTSTQSERQTTQVVEELVLIPARNALWQCKITESRKEQLWDYAVDYVVQKHNHTFDVGIGSYVVEWGLPPTPYANLSMPLLLHGDDDRRNDLTRELYHQYFFGDPMNPGFWVLKCVGKVLYVYDEMNNTVATTVLKTPA